MSGMACRLIFLGCLLTLHLAAGCTAVSGPGGSDSGVQVPPRIYTAHNLWYENPGSMYCINYQRGTLIPAGSEVEYAATLWILDRREARERSSSGAGEHLYDRREFGEARKGDFEREPLRSQAVIAFKLVGEDTEFLVAMQRRFHPGKSPDDYLDHMFTHYSFEKLVAGLSEKEVGAIRRGTVVDGMTKRAVLIAYGMPPQHQTPDLSAPVWGYWTSRFRAIRVCFDERERTTHCAGAR